MAGKKNRKTMGKNWKSISGDSSDDNWSARNIHSKSPKDISFVRRERSTRMKKTSKVLSKLCDDDSNSDTEFIKKDRPFRPSLPISITEKHKRKVSSSSRDSSSDAGQSEQQKSTMSSKKKTKYESSESENDLNSDVDLKKSNRNKSNYKIRSRKNLIDENKSSKGKTSANQSGFSSSEEFQKSKSGVKRKSRVDRVLDDDMGNYTIIETPSKSDDEKIVVDKLLEIKLKNIIVEELEKLQKLIEDFQSAFNLNSTYLVEKKIKFLKDSKFIPHKLLGLYNETFKKIKQSRNDFVSRYDKWLDSCTEKSTHLKSIPKTSFSLSSCEGTEKSDEDINRQVVKKTCKQRTLETAEDMKRFDAGSESEYERVISKLEDKQVRECESDNKSNNKRSSKPNSKSRSIEKSQSLPRRSSKPNSRSSSIEKSQSLPRRSSKPNSRSSSIEKSQSLPRRSSKPNSKSSSIEKSQSSPRRSSKPNSRSSSIEKSQSSPRRSSKPNSRSSSIEKSQSSPRRSTKPNSRSSSIEKSQSPPRRSSKPNSRSSSIEKLQSSPRRSSKPNSRSSSIEKLPNSPKRSSKPNSRSSSIEKLPSLPKRSSKPNSRSSSTGKSPDHPKRCSNLEESHNVVETEVPVEENKQMGKSSKKGPDSNVSNKSKESTKTDVPCKKKSSKMNQDSSHTVDFENNNECEESDASFTPQNSKKNLQSSKYSNKNKFNEKSIYTSDDSDDDEKATSHSKESSIPGSKLSSNLECENGGNTKKKTTKSKENCFEPLPIEHDTLAKTRFSTDLLSIENDGASNEIEKESAIIRCGSVGQVSDCDSNEIFSGDESRSKKSGKNKDTKTNSSEENEQNPESAKDDNSSLKISGNDKKLKHSTSSSSEDLFESTLNSEVPNTPIKSPDLNSKSKSLRKTLLMLDKPEENLMDSGITDLQNKNSNEDEDVKKPDVEETEAMNDLLLDFDSDVSTYHASKSDPESERSVDSSSTWKVYRRDQPESPSSFRDNALLKKKSELKMQTNKKRNSISSNSSSSASEDESTRRKKSVRSRSGLENGSGDDSPLKKRRRFALIMRNNRFIKADKKLRMVCQVALKHLPNRILKRHAKALEKSKRYCANKKLNSVTNIDSLETKKLKKNPVNSEDDIVKAKAEKRNKGKKTKLMKNIPDENNDIESDSDGLENSNDTGEIKKLCNSNTNEQDVDEVENQAIEALLDSCSSNTEDDNKMDIDNKETEKPKKTKAKNKNDKKDKSDSENENEDEKKDKKAWKEDKLLTVKLTDSESEEEKFNKSQEKKKTKKDEAENDKSSNDENLGSPIKKSQGKKSRKQRKKLVLDSDSDIVISSDEESKESDKASGSEEEKKEKKKKTKKRRRESSSSDYSETGEKKSTRRKRIKKVDSDSDDNDEQDSPGKGRKNIRKVLRDKHVADDTKKAAHEEEERLKRIAERQRLFNEMYDAKLAGEAKVDKLVLDFDEETKRELVVVDKELVKRLKPHQAQGIKFMWDACFESLTQIEKSEGSGCIIAHCMGLGKTFQVVTLAHTLLSNEKTGVETVMIVCPLSTVLNWVNEFKMWLKHVKNGDDIEIYELTKLKKNTERKYMLESWKKTGGVLIIGYEMFRNLTSTGKKMRKAMQESIMRSLVDPGADLVVCDEGHLLKNEESALSKAMKLVKTMRRIVLTGTPLQNNLKEYHCMVQFVKPNLLGTKKEFLNRFVNPITNGQFDDSTPYDVKLMKKRAHVLHKMLEGSVQRFDYSVLTPFLPPKQEYVIFVRLTDVQIKMYQHYLDNFARRYGGRNGSLFADFQELQRIWTHPYVLRLNAEKVDKVNEKKRLEASDSEGSLKDFIDDGSDSDSICSSSSQGSGSGSDVQCIDSDSDKPVVKTRSTRLNPKEESEEVPTPAVTTEEASWWSKYLEEKHFEDMRTSTKLLLLFGILRESEQIGDKVLVFSQSLYSLTLIEHFLNLIDQQTIEGGEAEHLDNHSGAWSLGLDYFRLDGSTSAENRSAWCKIFNNPNNTRARLFLISTRAGGLGINLTAANRVIIFDASWNPSHDVQSIFRIYRFGQKKPCYVYRFLAAGTMEEKIYNRQVTKLSLACRVVDEQQIERHYSNNDLAELYQFESYEDKSVTLALPKDRLLAEIFLKLKDSVYNYHEHDSLLENKAEEELDEEERKQAWQEYEDEKQGKRQIINMGMGMGVGMGMGMGMGNSLLGFNQMLMNMNNFPEMESIKLLIQKDYPNLPPEHLETVARQALYDMYHYVDQQAINQTLNSNPYAQANMFGGAMQQQTLNHQQQQFQMQNQMMNLNPLNASQMNYPGVNQMPVYSGRGRPPKHLSMNNQMTNLQKQLLNPVHLQQPQMPSGDVEIIPDPLAPSNANAASNSNNLLEEDANNIQEK